jgi:hypothetical protein
MNKHPFSRREVLNEEIELVLNGTAKIDLLPRYRDASIKDFANIATYLFWSAQRRHIIENPSLNYALTRRVFLESDPVLDAYAEMIPKESCVKTVISTGLFFSFDDLFLRLSCSSDFFTIDVIDGVKLWNGCECLWTYAGSAIKPKLRFYEYEWIPKRSEIAWGNGCEGTWLYAYVGAYPFDSERRRLSDFLMQVSISWILLHEEAHHLEGHLNFIARHLPSQDAQCLMDEIAEVECGSDSANLSKLFEWQADSYATCAIVDLFFSKQNLALLPSYCAEKRHVWLFRLLLVAIGSVILNFQNARANVGGSQANRRASHPLPRTRLLTCFFAALGEIHSEKWSILREVVDLDEDVSELLSEFLGGSLGGALEDLNTCSEILCREGNPENAIESLKANQSPQWRRIKDLTILDNRSDVTATFFMILSRILPEFSVPTGLDVRGMESEWCQEMDEEILPYRDSLSDLLSEAKASILKT